ncbi:glutaredoxin-like protein NrdH [Bombilactobacillus folatiphilus]|uniref:Glutaredoxin-like protein NrdH n=1 Tax=Bombilactobacillus folatiphilus TaxID=2923362 RepID=A0ABY4P913_9LACO|nr:glutaredoxin-like protein NrdH [Bombilactobacillus folatiphilus]UQS82233.1 glutaredoxin-like protein NrdH [Bombilactobacillus folatiphilus]
MKKTALIYTKNGCMQCKMTKRFLTEHQIDFQEVNINQQPESLATLKQQGFQSVPIVIADGVQPIVGFRPDELKALV